MEDKDSPVTRRQVFHIPGYDPIHPRRYRELYRKESATQAKISGYDIGLGSKSEGEDFNWSVRADMDGAKVLARIDVLMWSDIVKSSMAQTIGATYLQLLQTSWIYLSTGTFRRLMWMRKGPVIAALYPIVMLLAQLAFAIWIGGLLGQSVEYVLVLIAGQGAGLLTSIVATLGTLLKWLIWPAVVVIALRWFQSIDNRLFAYYLMHDYAFSARLRGANPPELEARMSVFSQTIENSFSQGADEVLVVGHSSGAYLAVSVVADLVRAGKVPKNGPKLALLTLGQVIPMVSFLPRARRLRGDLALLAASDALTWVDVSAPGDGCSFALCDPVSVTGVTPPAKKWPLVLTAAFTQSLSPARWKELRWRFFRLHFQYLCAFDRPKDYDYFQITAGPKSLAERYRGRPPSKSRIDVAASKYTSIEP